MRSVDGTDPGEYGIHALGRRYGSGGIRHPRARSTVRIRGNTASTRSVDGTDPGEYGIHALGRRYGSGGIRHPRARPSAWMPYSLGSVPSTERMGAVFPWIRT